MPPFRRPASLSVVLACVPAGAWAHASEQGFVLLLPTEVYSAAGVVAVLLTILALVFLPARSGLWVFATWRVPRVPTRAARRVTSLGSFALLAALVWVGLVGPRDPLGNPLPLAVWTVFWIALVTGQAVLGDVWRWINPFDGPLWLLRPARVRPLPRAWRDWPALLGFALFAYVLLADPAPSDPARLARIVAAYWAVQFAMCLMFGPIWLRRAEPISAMMRALSRCAALGRGRVGLPGWQIAARRSAGLAAALLCVFLLGTGSFDGLSETFWWLGVLGINPFEYPGRSALIGQTLAGLLLANLMLLLVFVGALAAGQRLAGQGPQLTVALRAFAPTLLPIAAGYHVAHYLPSFLVDGQYALVALSDPLMTGADLLNLGEFFVSTGFFNSRDSVRAIYLTQAGAVVAGHVVAVLAAHAVALRLYGGHRAAVLSQVPLAAFMLGYTWFGLWLLSSPRF